MTDERAAAVARRMALMARMKNLAKEVWGSDPIRRVHLVVTIDRFLVRLLETTSWGDWVLKGGYANQLRHPSGARFTEDVDIRIDADISGATAMVTDALTQPIEDPFEFELASPPRDLVGPPGGGMRYPVIARLVGQELVRFKIDVSSRDAIVGDLERYPSDPIIEMLDLVPALFPVYPVAQQFAEKLHAYTLPRDIENTRTKDLADMLWLMSRHTLASGELIDACTATFEQRDEHDWPPTLPQPPKAWARPYAVLRDEMDIAAATADDAFAKLSAFLAPVLRSDRGLHWGPGGGWVATRETD